MAASSTSKRNSEQPYVRVSCFGYLKIYNFLAGCNLAIFGMANIMLSEEFQSQYHELLFVYKDVVSARLLAPVALSEYRGFMLLLIVLVGFIGIFMNNESVLKWYCLFLVTMTIFNMYVIVLALTITSETVLEEIKISVPIQQYVEDSMIQEKIDNLQVKLRCCGNISYHDYAGMEYSGNHSVIAVSLEDGEDVVVPTSCYLQGRKSAPAYRVSLVGCRQVIIRVYQQKLNGFGVTGVAIMVFMFAGLYCTLRCIRHLRKVSHELSQNLGRQYAAQGRDFNEHGMYQLTYDSNSQTKPVRHPDFGFPLKEK